MPKTDTREKTAVLDVTSLGATLKRTSRRQVELTKEEARRILDDLAVFDEVDRPVRASHVDYLVNAMRRKTFVSSWVFIITCVCKEVYQANPPGTIYRINGQHTCRARQQMATSYRCPITIERWYAETVDDMRQLYATCDRLAPRTKANVIQSWIGGTDEFKDATKQNIKVVSAALQYFLWDTAQERTANDGDAVAFLMRTDHYSVCIKLSNFLRAYPNNKDHRHIWRAPVCGAMLATMEKAPVVASDRFWSCVATGTGIESSTDPRLKLRNALITASIQSGGGSRTGKSMVTGEQMYRWCLSCWNAYREGREISSIRNPQERPKLR